MKLFGFFVNCHEKTCPICAKSMLRMEADKTNAVSYFLVNMHIFF